MKTALIVRVLAGIFVCAAALFASGCNTVKGAGEDLAAIGRGIAEFAEDVSN